MTEDIKNYYLNNPMTQFKYMLIFTKHITQEIRDKYDIYSISVNRHVHVEIRKGVYGLTGARILAFNQLVTHLASLRYHSVKNTP